MYIKKNFPLYYTKTAKIIYRLLISRHHQYQLKVHVMLYRRALILLLFLVLISYWLHNQIPHCQKQTKRSMLEEIMHQPSSSPMNPIRPYVVDHSNADSAYWTMLRNLPPYDYSRLFNISDFDFCMQQPRCAPQVKAIIMVHTAPGNVHKRNNIRSSWGSVIPNTPTHAVRLLFVLGQTANKTLQRKLESENARFRDMVQGNFVDAYLNMTYKHLAVFKWFIYRCAHAHFLIKLDDDSFLNTFLLYRFLNVSKAARYNSPMANIAPVEYNFFHGRPQSIFCRKQNRSLVKRTWRSKWRISRKQYSPKRYPDYCAGYVIFYPASVVLRLYNAAWDTKSFFWVDDVYVTGMLRERIHVSQLSSESLHLRKKIYEKLLQVWQEPERAKEMPSIITEPKYLFAWPSISSQESQLLWQITCDKWQERTSKAIKTAT